VVWPIRGASSFPSCRNDDIAYFPVTQVGSRDRSSELREGDGVIGAGAAEAAPKPVVASHNIVYLYVIVARQCYMLHQAIWLIGHVSFCFVLNVHCLDGGTWLFTELRDHDEIEIAKKLGNGGQSSIS